MTYLQQIYAIRLHALHPLTYGLFHDWSGRHHRSKYAPFCCANDLDRRLEVFDSSALSTTEIIIIKKGERRFSRSDPEC